MVANLGINRDMLFHVEQFADNLMILFLYSQLFCLACNRSWTNAMVYDVRALNTCIGGIYI